MMDELRNDLAGMKESLGDVKRELADRPTRKQTVIALVGVALLLIVNLVATYFDVRASSSSDAAVESTRAAQSVISNVDRGFAIAACRASIRSETLDVAVQSRDEAVQVRASAIQERDNLTNEALSALATDDEERFLQVAALTPSARERVFVADLAVQQAQEAVSKAQEEYRRAFDLSTRDPARFLKQCEARGN